jgi:hypothetical protein
MKKIVSAILMVVMAVTPTFAFNKVKTKSKQHAAMHVIVMIDKDEEGNVHGGLCTAYAVGPHTLLTAEHCNDAKTNAVFIDNTDTKAIKEGKAMSYTVTARVFDHQDHMLMDISGVYFKNTIPMDWRTPVQGEHTYQWGNPGGMRDQYREGYVVGEIPPAPADSDDEEKIDATAGIWIIAEPVIGGDSGSAIFSAVDGRMIGVLTYGIDEGQLAGVYEIKFTPEQIQESMK